MSMRGSDNDDRKDKDDDDDRPPPPGKRLEGQCLSGSYFFFPSNVC
jgi:hypothetical protein